MNPDRTGGTVFAPTAEQTHALELFLTGESLAIEAGAGTGKTSTLIILAEALLEAHPRKRIQYVAFNRAIVKEAGTKMPSNTTCSTAHSLAYRAIATEGFKNRQQSGKRMRSLDIANVLTMDGVNVVTFAGAKKHLSRAFLAGLVMQGVNRFCQTADPAPTHRHIPRVEGLDLPGSYEVNNAVAKACEKALERAWADLTTEGGALPFTTSTAMSVYLKLWQLSGPRIGADVILFDEAQDANPVMVAVVAAQTHSQLVWVGDSQQQIYAFTGAVNALASVPSDQRAFLTQSFRFGPAVAEVANSILKQIPSAELRLVGTDSINSVVGPVIEPDAILSRTNASAVRAVLTAQSQDKRPHLVGGGKEIVAFTKAAQSLMSDPPVKVDHPELACFDSWTEVQEYVEMDEQGGDLRLMVKLVDEFTVTTILTALDNMVDEKDADLIVSTAHKSKGREWNSVTLAGDFPEPKTDEATGQLKMPSDDELRLMYVAVTRAKRELDLDNVPFIRDGYVPTTETPIVATTAAKAEQVVAANAGQIEIVETRKSEHVGTVGQKTTLTLTVESCIGMKTKYGYTFLTILLDEDGNRFKTFSNDEMEVGATYMGIWNVKAHAEFRGEKETALNYATAVERVEVTA